VAVGEAGDAAAGDAVGEANWCAGGVPAAVVAFPGSVGLGDGERGGIGDVAGGVDALAINGDALCAPLAPPIHV
jgi:hypothetical protein